MDTARYVIGVLLVVGLPPGLAWWFVVHPFVTFWRRVGARRTLGVVTVAALAGVAGLFVVRDELLMTDLGTHTPLLAVAAVLLVATVWIATLRRRHLTFRILAGLPELEDGGEPGELLDEGIYARIRHPRYVEVVLASWTYAVFANYLGAYVVAAITIPLLHLIVLLEERELVARFGARYEEYRSRVPRYVPVRRRK
jgi:protein-S-isoprenylcysteine O-methyltransferase Ste14